MLDNVGLSVFCLKLLNRHYVLHLCIFIKVYLLEPELLLIHARFWSFFAILFCLNVCNFFMIMFVYAFVLYFLRDAWIWIFKVVLWMYVHLQLNKMLTFTMHLHLVLHAQSDGSDQSDIYLMYLASMKVMKRH